MEDDDTVGKRYQIKIFQKNKRGTFQRLHIQNSQRVMIQVRKGVGEICEKGG